MSYSIFRVAKVKNSVDTKALQRHNQRENKNYGNKDIDHARTHLNFDLINPEKIQYTKKIEERIDEGYQGTRKIRSDAVKHVDGIVTSDKEFFDRLSPEKQKQFFKDSLEFIKAEYGENNVLYATVHLDEKTPHMHFGFVPLTEDGRLSAKEVLGNKKAMSDLQDHFNNFVNQKGYNLERGERATGAEHIEIMKYKEKTLKQNLEKLQGIDQRVMEVDALDNKTKQILNQVTMNKNDFEAFKSVAKTGIVVQGKFEELKKTSAETVKKLTIENKQLQKERDHYMDSTKELRKENQKLKQEISVLRREVERFKNYTINALSNVKEGMRKLSEQLKNKELFTLFNKQIFNPSLKKAKEEYLEDQEQEKRERRKENEHAKE